MATTQNTYTGNGSTVLYSFTFPYLETTDIKVSLNGTVTTAYTLANATTIQFTTAPANGAAIRIYRQTDDSNLQSTFYPGSAIRSSDLNDNFTQNLYVTQEANNVSAAATTTANAASTTANTALSNSNTAISTANAATATANTASSNASAAVTTANAASATATTASSNATTAVNTANSAVSTANAATATANAATATAASAVTTANTAAADATTAISTANAAQGSAATAVSTANSAVSTANAATATAAGAVTTANNAVTTADGAVTTATGAVTTANTALSTANAAASAVANAILYDTVPNVAAIPASPANNDAVEVVNSTGIESFTPLSGKPAGYVGDSGLSVRLVYTTTGNTWNWIQYFPNDPESRYGDAIVTLQGDVTAVEGDVATLQSDVLGLDNSKAPTSNPTFTGAVKVADGTAAAPSITFASDTNLGLYRISENKMGLTSNGALVATIDNGQLAIEDSLWAGDNAWIETSGKFAVYQSAAGKGTIRFYDADASNYVSFEGPVSISSNVTWTLPSADGSNGQFLKTDGTGVLSWGTVDTSTLAPLASPTFTGTVTVGTGTTAQRPATAAAGMFRFNTTSAAFEGYDGTQWGAIGGAPTTAPPVINSVALAEVDTTGARFTSKNFTVTTTMVGDGTPVSQKGVKATVGASLQTYPATGTISSVAPSVPSSVTLGSETLIDSSVGSTGVFKYYDSTNKVGGFGCFHHNGTAIGLKTSRDATTWQSVANTITANGNCQYAKQVGEYVFAATGPDTGSTSWIARVSALQGFRSFNYGNDMALADNGRYYNADRSGIWSWADPYDGTDYQPSAASFNFYDVPLIAFGNGRLLLAGRAPATQYYPKVMTSTDYGASFPNSVNIGSTNSAVYALHFFNGYFYVSAQSYGILRSTNGTTWTSVSPDGTAYARQIVDDGTYLYAKVGVKVWRSSNNGTNWILLGTQSGTAGQFGMAVGWGRVLIGIGSTGGSKVQSATYATQVLSLNSSQNLGTVGGINTNDFVRMSAGDSSFYANVVAVSAATPSITLGNIKPYVAGNTVVALNPTGSPQTVTNYLVIDSSGNVTDMQSADPGFVNYGPGTSVTLKFPATFPTGNAPDTELPAGTTIRAEVQAVNSVATDTELSNIVTPT